METYLLSLPIKPVEIGRTYAQLPLHCTVFQYFSTNIPFLGLRRELSAIAGNTNPIELTGGEPALFGKSSDVPVNLVEETPELRALHETIRTWLIEQHAMIYNPEWAGDGYRPHVSVVDGEAFTSGMRVTVNRIALVQELIPQRKQITALFPLG